MIYSEHMQRLSPRALSSYIVSTMFRTQLHVRDHSMSDTRTASHEQLSPGLWDAEIDPGMRRCFAYIFESRALC